MAEREVPERKHDRPLVKPLSEPFGPLSVDGHLSLAGCPPHNRLRTPPGPAASSAPPGARRVRIEDGTKQHDPAPRSNRATQKDEHDERARQIKDDLSPRATAWFRTPKSSTHGLALSDVQSPARCDLAKSGNVSTLPGSNPRTERRLRRHLRTSESLHGHGISRRIRVPHSSRRPTMAQTPVQLALGVQQLICDDA